MERAFPDELRIKIDRLVNKYIKNQIFTACSVAFCSLDEKPKKEFFYHNGSAGRPGGEVPLDRWAFFDLASLTKPLVTSLALLSLIDEGRCQPEDRLDKFFHLKPTSDKKSITLENLLTHSSGLPAHRPYYKKLLTLPEHARMAALFEWILAEKIHFMPGTDTLYSDLGFIVLGRIVEILAGEPLDRYWERTIIRPLRLETGLFFAARRQMDAQVYVPTGSCPWSDMSLYGQVHDDNCRAMGGVAGHAGLFGTAGGVLALCRELLFQYGGDSSHPAYRRETLLDMFSIKKGEWTFGFDTPTPPLSSSGKYFSSASIGHLGFTGTSFWIDLEKGRIVVLLTNRVFCGNNLLAMKTFRPLLHDIVMEDTMKNPRKN
ncbi:MAG: serine hydrolase domain-containing protein [Desulforhopalus sp.]